MHSASGDRIILAPRAAHVAAPAAERENFTPREKTGKRFFLNGIERQPGDLTVVQADDFSVPESSCSAESLIILAQLAMMKTDITIHL